MSKYVDQRVLYKIPLEASLAVYKIDNSDYVLAKVVISTSFGDVFLYPDTESSGIFNSFVENLND